MEIEIYFDTAGKQFIYRNDGKPVIEAEAIRKAETGDYEIKISWDGIISSGDFKELQRRKRHLERLVQQDN